MSQEVIDLCGSSDEEEVRFADEEDDEALARRLQQEEWVDDGGAGPSARTAPVAEPQTELEWSRHYQSEQNAQYEASLAADRAKEADKRAAEEAARAEAAAQSAAQSAAQQAAEAAQAAAQTAVQDKEAARARWSAQEPADGLALVLRFADGSRVQRRFDARTTVADLQEACVALGPLPFGTAVQLSFGFPRRTLAPGEGCEQTLAEAGVEGAVLVAAVDDQ